MEKEITEVKERIIEWMKSDTKDKERMKTLNYYAKHFSKIKKIDINSTFGFYKKLANGEKGKILLMPDLELMHCSEQFIPDWVEYSCFDAEILYFLRETLSY